MRIAIQCTGTLSSNLQRCACHSLAPSLACLFSVSYPSQTYNTRFTLHKGSYQYLLSDMSDEWLIVFLDTRARGGEHLPAYHGNPAPIQVTLIWCPFPIALTQTSCNTLQTLIPASNLDK